MNTENMIRLEFPATEVVEASARGFVALMEYFLRQLCERYANVVQVFDKAILMDNDEERHLSMTSTLASMIAMEARLLVNRKPLPDYPCKFTVVFLHPQREPEKVTYWTREEGNCSGDGGKQP